MELEKYMNKLECPMDRESMTCLGYSWSKGSRDELIIEKCNIDETASTVVRMVNHHPHIRDTKTVKYVPSFSWEPIS